MSIVVEEGEYWNALVPELTVSCLERSLPFYLAAGFSVRFRRLDPPFAYLTLGRAQLMLEQQHASSWNTAALDRPFGRGVNFQVEVPLLARITERLLSAGFVLFRETRECWYATGVQQEGQLELLAQDPDGYLLRFIQVLGTRKLEDRRRHVQSDSGGQD